MSKYILGLGIPYYKNSEECEVAFKKLMEQIKKQMRNDVLIVIYEDGQYSEWLNDYENIIHIWNKENNGVSYARNVILNWSLKQCEYILFVDSDDMIADDYIKVMCDYCYDRTHEVIESIYTDGKYTTQFERYKIRSGISGVAIQSKIIGNIRFDEKRQIGEDTKFSNEVIDLTKHRKKQAKTIYYYQYGRNPNSLLKRYKRKEIGEMR